MKFQFVDKEFNNMMFNPTKLSEGDDIFKVFPELKKHKIFLKSPGKDLDNTMVMLWIMCMYDKNTPYRSKYKDVLKRKVEVAHDVGFETMANGLFSEAVEKFLKGGNEIVNEKIVEFIRMHKSFKYSYFVAMENSYYTILFEVMNGNTKRISDLRSIQEELEEVLTQLLNEDDNPYLREAILRYVEDERLNLRPEDIALKKANGELHTIFNKEIFGQSTH